MVGLNDQIRGVADRLARCGYFALVPDLYRGKSTVEEEEAHHLMTGPISATRLRRTFRAP